MKYTVRYQSRNGNTRSVAEAIAKNLNIEAQSIDTPITEYTDVLLLGGGVYGGKMDKNLHTYIDNLAPEKIGQIVAFSTTGLQHSTLTQIREYATKKGIRVSNQELLLKMLIQGHSAFGLKGGKLKKDQLLIIKDFTNKIQEKL